MDKLKLTKKLGLPPGIAGLGLKKPLSNLQVPPGVGSRFSVNTKANSNLQEEQSGLQKPKKMMMDSQGRMLNDQGQVIELDKHTELKINQKYAYKKIGTTDLQNYQQIKPKN